MINWEISENYLLTLICITWLWCLILSIVLMRMGNKIKKGENNMEDEDKLRAFNEEMEQRQFYTNVDPAITQNIPQQTQGENFREQTIINETIATASGPPPSPVPTSFGRCDQCGTFHPPLKDGQKCPVAPIKSKEGEPLDLNPFFAQLKNICVSQIEQKGIKNHDKLFQHVILEVTKSLENYHE